MAVGYILTGVRRAKLEIPLIDVKKLISRYSLEQLNEAVEQYWRLHADSEALQVKPFTLTEIQHLLVQFAHLIGGLELNAGMTVLDFGAGSCWASRILNQLGMRVISCDVSQTALDLGRKLRDRHPPYGQQPEQVFLRFDGRRFDLPDESVDRVFCLDALHHVSSQNDVVREMARILRQGGIAGFSEPGPNHSRHPGSQFEMRNYTAIENDICLDEIFAAAKESGFTQMKVAVAPIHPTMVSLADLDSAFSNPAELAATVRDRVTNYPIFFLFKGEPRVRDSQAPAGLIAKTRIEGASAVTDTQTPVRFRFTAQNCSSKTWLPSGSRRGSVNIGAFLHSPGRQEPPEGRALPRQYRFSLSVKEVAPGQTVSAEIDLGRLEPGEHTLEVDLVSEDVCWFQTNCDSRITLHLQIGP
jgi:SAM-dependent methyltransferase